MYRNDPNTGDRAGTTALVALIHVGLGYAFLNLSGTMRVIERQIIPRLIDVDVLPPAPPIVEVPLEKENPRRRKAPPRPRTSRAATPVAAPKPKIELPVPPPILITETPRVGSDPDIRRGAVRGPGTGAGGIGTGTGSGGSGSGTGGGGSGQGTRPVLLTPTSMAGATIRAKCFAAGRVWPGVRALCVDVVGHPYNCNVDRSSGDPMVDQWTCSLVVSRLASVPPPMIEAGRSSHGPATSRLRPT